MGLKGWFSGVCAVVGQGRGEQVLFLSGRAQILNVAGRRIGKRVLSIRIDNNQLWVLWADFQEYRLWRGGGEGVAN